MALIIKRTALAGGTDPTISTVYDLFDLIFATLLEAGWVKVSDTCFFSTGENGREAIFQDWTPSSTTYLQRYMYQYHDGVQGFNGIGNTYCRYSIPVSTYHYVIMADKDSLVWFIHAGSGNGHYNFSGNLKRDSGVIPENVRTTVDVSAGARITIPLAEDPRPLGYEAGLSVMMAAQSPAAIGTTIPIFQCIIEEVGTDYVVVDRVPEAVPAGALFGNDPMPYAHTITDGRAIFSDVFVGNVFEQRANLFTAVPDANGWRHTAEGYIRGASVDPNRRTGRVGIERLAIIRDDVRGYLDKLYYLHQPTAQVWDVARLIKADPVKDYLVIPMGTARCVIGPVN